MANIQNEIIKSVSYDQTEIIDGILKLYSKNNQIDLDPTYSKGKFYDNTGIKVPTYCFDINPQTPNCKEADCRNLPLKDECVEVMMFDPPFLATTGKSLQGTDENNIINKRFGVYPSEKELHQFYVDSLREAYRVIKPNGILIFKCQDKVSSGKQYMSHNFIINAATKVGFYPKDIFILVARNRLIANWQRNQQHSRKYHSYFLVFQKCNTKISYT